MTLVYTHSTNSSPAELDPTAYKAPGRPIYCKRCSTVVTTTRFLVSRAYRGFRGKAALYSHVDSEATAQGPTSVQLMQTGAYTVRALTCGTCHAYLGFTFVRAHEKSEEWKAEHSVLENSAVREEMGQQQGGVSIPSSSTSSFESAPHPPGAPLEPRRLSMAASSSSTSLEAASDVPEEMAGPQSHAHAGTRRPQPRGPPPHSVWRKTVVKLSAGSILSGVRHSRHMSTDVPHAPWVIDQA